LVVYGQRLPGIKVRNEKGLDLRIQFFCSVDRVDRFYFQI
jgi:hypothetical protein